MPRRVLLRPLQTLFELPLRQYLRRDNILLLLLALLPILLLSFREWPLPLFHDTLRHTRLQRLLSRSRLHVACTIRIFHECLSWLVRMGLHLVLMSTITCSFICSNSLYGRIFPPLALEAAFAFFQFACLQSPNCSSANSRIGRVARVFPFLCSLAPCLPGHLPSGLPAR